jgi:hypothetical protein
MGQERNDPTPEADEKKSRGLGSYVVWAFVAVMVYALSSGPVLRWYYDKEYRAGRDGFAHKLLTTVYLPLDWVYDHTLLHRPLGMYWRLWCPVLFTPYGEAIRALGPSKFREA